VWGVVVAKGVVDGAAVRLESARVVRHWRTHPPAAGKALVPQSSRDRQPSAICARRRDEPWTSASASPFGRRGTRASAAPPRCSRRPPPACQTARGAAAAGGPGRRSNTHTTCFSDAVVADDGARCYEAMGAHARACARMHGGGGGHGAACMRPKRRCAPARARGCHAGPCGPCRDRAGTAQGPCWPSTLEPPPVNVGVFHALAPLQHDHIPPATRRQLQRRREPGGPAAHDQRRAGHRQARARRLHRRRLGRSGRGAPRRGAARPRREQRAAGHTWRRRGGRRRVGGAARDPPHGWPRQRWQPGSGQRPAAGRLRGSVHGRVRAPGGLRHRGGLSKMDRSTMPA
jgi:hypothetical protein